MDWTLTPSTTKKRKEWKSVGSLAVHVINVLLTANARNTVLDTCLHACTAAPLGHVLDDIARVLGQ